MSHNDAKQRPATIDLTGDDGEPEAKRQATSCADQPALALVQPAQPAAHPDVATIVSALAPERRALVLELITNDLSAEQMADIKHVLHGDDLENQVVPADPSPPHSPERVESPEADEAQGGASNTTQVFHQGLGLCIGRRGTQHKWIRTPAGTSECRYCRTPRPLADVHVPSGTRSGARGTDIVSVPDATEEEEEEVPDEDANAFCEHLYRDGVQPVTDSTRRSVAFEGSNGFHRDDVPSADEKESASCTDPSSPDDDDWLEEADVEEGHTSDEEEKDYAQTIEQEAAMCTEDCTCPKCRTATEQCPGCEKWFKPEDFQENDMHRLCRGCMDDIAPTAKLITEITQTDPGTGDGFDANQNPLGNRRRGVILEGDFVNNEPEDSEGSLDDDVPICQLGQQ